MKQKIYVVTMLLSENGADAHDFICFKKKEKAEEFITNLRKEYIRYCEEKHYQYTQTFELNISEYSTRYEDYSTTNDSIFILQTNKKRNPFMFSAQIEERELN